jgi:outer membrane protein assembly factor BamD (BamD/ComL family)
MGKGVNGRTRNFIVYSMVLLGIITAVLNLSLGEKQDKEFENTSRMYEEAKNAMKQSNFEHSSSLFQKLVTKQPDSYILLWNYGISLAAQQKYEEGYKYLVKTRQQHPFVVRDQQYLMQTGQVLYYTGKYTDAKRYIEEGIKLNTSADLTKKMEIFLDEIKQKTEKK